MRIFTEFSQERKERERLSGRPEGMVCCGKQLKCGFSLDEIQRLRRLMREGIPERISRS